MGKQSLAAALGIVAMATALAACGGGGGGGSISFPSISTQSNNSGMPPDLLAAKILGDTLAWHDNTEYRYTRKHWVPTGWTRSQSILGRQYAAYFYGKTFEATVYDKNPLIRFVEPAGSSQWFAIDRTCAGDKASPPLSCYYVVASDGTLVTLTQYAEDVAAAQQPTSTTTVTTVTTVAPPPTTVVVTETQPDQSQTTLPPVTSTAPVGGTGQPTDPAAQEWYQIELNMIQEEELKAAEVWVEPDCNFSYNGCAP